MTHHKETSLKRGKIKKRKERGKWGDDKKEIATKENGKTTCITDLQSDIKLINKKRGVLLTLQSTIALKVLL